MDLKPELNIAKKCTGYAMCKIDFLDTGVCAAGEKFHYLAYYPQGRMRLFPYFVSGELPITKTLIHIIESCDLCGLCDIQCYFVSENTPSKVMIAMKRLLKKRLENKKIVTVLEDQILKELRDVAGEEWVTNDPAVLLSYISNDRLLSSVLRSPNYVVLPGSTRQVAEIVKIANKQNIKFLPRSSGTSPLVYLKNGIIIDMKRMNYLDINKREEFAVVGPGITGFELQKKCEKTGLKAPIGESSACICANMVSTGIHSFFSFKYGTMADLFINAEFVTRQGKIIDTTSEEFKAFCNISTLRHDPQIELICTSLKIKLFKIKKDETSVLIPFKSFEEALKITRDIARKGVGSGIILTSVEMMKSFMTITELDAENFYDIAKDYLKIDYGLLIFCTKKEVGQIKAIIDKDIPILNNNTIGKIIRGIYAITGPESMMLIETVMDEPEPYKTLFGKMLNYFLNNIDVTVEDVQDLFLEAGTKQLNNALCKLFFKPQFSDMKYWLTYRPSIPRIGRKDDFVPHLCLCSFEDLSLVQEICTRLKSVAKEYKVSNYLSHITPLNRGKLIVLDYDFHFKRHDKKSLRSVKKAFFKAEKELEKLADQDKRIFLLKKTRLKGFLRKEDLLSSEAG